MNPEDVRDDERLTLAVELRHVWAQLIHERRQSRDRLVAMRPVYEQLRHVVLTMQATKFWWLRQRWFALKKRLGLSAAGASPHYEPPTVEALIPVDEYELWLRDHDYRESDASWMRSAVKAMRMRPRFSILVPVYDAPEPYLTTMLDSVLEQIYPDWEICIANDASRAPHVRMVLDRYAQADPRIKIVHRETNGHISAATNSALELATGEFVALLDHDDVLAPDALFHNALLINEDPNVDMIYSDEDKINDEGVRSEPFFKPDWSPDRFLSQMYTSHFGVYRASLMREIGGFRVGFEGSQDYDLVLRFTEHTKRVRHIPRVLYHWRKHAASTASAMHTKSYAETAAMRALSEALERRGEPGTVSQIPQLPGSYCVRYIVREHKRVSIIVPTRDHGDDVDRCLRSVFSHTDYPDFEVILLDNGSKDFQALETFAKWSREEPHRFRALRRDVPFNFSAINNFAVRNGASGHYLLFLNNDTEATHADWLTAMVEQAQRDSVGAVGAKLLYDDKRVQHAGVVLGIGGIAGHAFRFFPRDHLGYHNAMQMITNYSAVTAACMMMRRDVFEEVGGFDEELAVAYNDVDLCLRIRDRGYSLVYVPHVELFHYESKSRGYDTTPDRIERDTHEKALMERRWRFSSIRDPYYNQNLTLLREDFSLAP